MLKHTHTNTILMKVNISAMWNINSTSQGIRHLLHKHISCNHRSDDTVYTILDCSKQKLISSVFASTQAVNQNLSRFRLQITALHLKLNSKSEKQMKRIITMFS